MHCANAEALKQLHESLNLMLDKTKAQKILAPIKRSGSIYLELAFLLPAKVAYRHAKKWLPKLDDLKKNVKPPNVNEGGGNAPKDHRVAVAEWDKHSQAINAAITKAMAAKATASDAAKYTALLETFLKHLFTEAEKNEDKRLLQMLTKEHEHFLKTHAAKHTTLNTHPLVFPSL